MLNKLFNKSNPLGSWLQIGDPEFTSMMIQSGFDFLVIDMEHGSISEGDLPALFQVFNGTDCIPMVRVANNDSIFIRRALDLGAKGIIVPGVKSKEDVTKAENAIYYPPKGDRGIGYSKANNYGMGFNEYFKSSNDDVLFVAQIEHEVAVKNINEIFSSDNIDSYIIGPYDLTGSMGIVGEFDNPNYLNNLDIIKKSAVKNGIRSGIHVVSPEVNQLKTAINEGYEFIAYSTDALLMYDRCKTDLNSARKLRTK
jgi:2-dehydro-3-deoxyglucarate aldolase